MPSSDYSTPVRGALKLKGGVPNPSGVTKKKKKKSSSSSKPLTDIERNLSTGGGGGGGGEDDNERSISLAPGVKDGKGKEKIQQEEDTQQQQQLLQQQQGGNDDSDSDSKNKTDAERRFAEVKRKRLKELASNDPAAAKAVGLRPELLKTHKQRVEELNSHLSRLSEHHDMPKIGPG